MDNEYKQKMELELLKKDISQLNKFMEDFNKSIDKLEDATDKIDKIVYIQEQKFHNQERFNKDIEHSLEEHRKEHNKDIAELHNRITNFENKLLIEIQNIKEDLSSKISEINKWRYMLMGAVAICSFLFAKLLDVMKLFR